MAVEPLPPGLLAELVEEPVERVEEVLGELARVLRSVSGRGFVLARIAGGARLQTHPGPGAVRRALRQSRGVASPLDRRARDARHRRLPPARLGRQISALRGVNVDGVTRLLEQRGYIEVVGQAEGPGQPALFGTTDLFLERLGLDSLEQLPAVEDFLPGPEVAGDLERDLQSALGLGVEAASDDT